MAFRLGEMRSKIVKTGAESRGQVGLGKLWREVDLKVDFSSESKKNYNISRWHHFSQALSNLRASPVNSVLTIVSTALMLSIFGVFLSFLFTSRSVISNQQAALSLNVYLKSDSTVQERANIKNTIESLKELATLNFIDSDEAMERLKGTLADDAGLLEGIGTRNPLPSSFEVLFSSEATREIATYAKNLERLAGVEAVVYDRGVFDSIGEMLQGLASLALVGIPLLFLIVGFVIASTVRLSLHSNQEEIQIMKLIGATEHYIRAPFLLAAILQGLFGAILALFFVSLCTSVLSVWWENIGFLSFLGEAPAVNLIWIAIPLVALGTGIALISSYLTLKLFLKSQ